MADNGTEAKRRRRRLGIKVENPRNSAGKIVGDLPASRENRRAKIPENLEPMGDRIQPRAVQRPDFGKMPPKLGERGVEDRLAYRHQPFKQRPKQIGEVIQDPLAQDPLVPVMLMLVKICLKTMPWFGKAKQAA